MTRFRHIPAAGLVAIAILSVAAPGLVCVLGMSSSHSCCAPTTKVQDGLPSSGASSCCVVNANNGNAAPAAAFRDVAPAAQVVAAYRSSSDAADQWLMSAPATDASPPACRILSILRI